MATKAGPYLYRRYANSIAVECTFEHGTKLVTDNGGILEYDASWKPAPRAKAPAKPRRPSTRVLVRDLPLSNTPFLTQPNGGCGPLDGQTSARGLSAAEVAEHALASDRQEVICPVGVASCAAKPTVESLPVANWPNGTPARSLTPSQVRTLETAIAFGIATPEASAKFDAWRREEARKNLEALTARQHPLAWLRRILSPSMGGRS